jgi:hypothetical protein
VPPSLFDCLSGPFAAIVRRVSACLDPPRTITLATIDDCLKPSLILPCPFYVQAAALAAERRAAEDADRQRRAAEARQKQQVLIRWFNHAFLLDRPGGRLFTAHSLYSVVRSRVALLTCSMLR